ncbi:MAG TPA: HNH endonuclease [Pyrinomonadaceae bacterium]|jgi:hypothetical protein|nr:HNH endonuclease [Pyrinomonadaceae bacterium]
MSRKIEHILEVIEEIWEQYQNTESDITLTEMRINAVRAVAGRRSVNISTINDTFLRQLGDSVNSTQDFDLLVEQWLHQDSGQLKAILLRHTSDPADIPKINNVFSKVSEPDVFLAREFGLEPSEEIFIEGKQKLKLHLVKERNRYLVKRAKEIWKHKPDGMQCTICSFSFIQTYGTVGEGFIEAHHSKPISTLEPDTIVRPSDLVPVCSNCHRMLHRRRPWLTVDELKNVVESHAGIKGQGT